MDVPLTSDQLTNFIRNENRSIRRDEDFIFKILKLDDQKVSRLDFVVLHHQLLQLNWRFDVCDLRWVDVDASDSSFENIVGGEESFEVFNQKFLPVIVSDEKSDFHVEGDRRGVKRGYFIGWQRSSVKTKNK